MYTNLSAMNRLLEAINILLNKKVQVLPYMIIAHGRITEVIGNNIYKVIVGGTEITVPCITDQQFERGNFVVLMRSNGNCSSSFIIGRDVKVRN